MSALRITLNGFVLDRRAFLGSLSLTAAGSLLIARDWSATTVSHISIDKAGTWHVDDMWGHMPRYAHPIPCYSAHQPVSLDAVDPVDHAFVT